MAAQFTYSVAIVNGEIAQISRIADGFHVQWSDADFTLWNSAQPTPYVLGPRNLLIQKLKALTLAQWQDGTTVPILEKDKIAFYIMKLALKDEII